MNELNLRVPLLRQGNSDLRRDRIWVWSLPAWVIELPNGEVFNTCPAAGICHALCYAMQGTFNFSNVKAAHARNLQMIRNDLPGWEATMDRELSSSKRFKGAYVRIHDGGDFFSDEYLEAWIRIAANHPDTTFYAYTKEVSRFKRLADDVASPNFQWLYSLGGREDHLIDMENDRHCDVFPDMKSLVEAGYSPQGESDLMSITLPTNRVGIVANNHRHLLKRQGSSSFGDLQQKRHQHAEMLRGVKPRKIASKDKPLDDDLRPILGVQIEEATPRAQKPRPLYLDIGDRSLLPVIGPEQPGTPDLKALSLSRPWLSMIQYCGKNVENRSWTTQYRGPLVLHSAASWDKYAAYFADHSLPEDIARSVRDSKALGGEQPTGYIGVAQLSGVHEAGDKGCECAWGMPDKFHWELTEPMWFEHAIPGRGKQRLFRPPVEVQEAADYLVRGFTPVDLATPRAPMGRDLNLC